MEKHSSADGFKQTFEDLYEVDGNIGELVNTLNRSALTIITLKVVIRTYGSADSLEPIRTYGC